MLPMSDAVAEGGAHAVQTQEEASVEDAPRETSGDETLNVRFKPRKRARHARVRRTAAASADTDAQAKESEATRHDVVLLREAQQFRVSARRNALGNGLVRPVSTSVQPNSESEADVAQGLQNSFAVERSGHAIEARMDKYIEEKMRERFGVTKDENAERKDVSGDGGFEDELYAIPEHLRVAQRPMYDPGEGLPASGVEEVQLPDEVRKRNEEETRKAKEALLEARARNAEKVDKQFMAQSNVSANFVKHRREWIETHVGTRGGRGTSKARQLGAVARPSKHGEGGRQEAGKANSEDRERGGRAHASYNNNARRYELATDSLVLDRFRKRWRR